jgi:DNA-binding CsgD family transcriptional regulator
LNIYGRPPIHMSLPSERLSAYDLKDVLYIGRVALECKGATEMVNEVLHLLEPVFKTGSSNFFFSKASVNEMDLHRVISDTIQEENFALFRRYYHGLDPFIGALSSRARPTVLTTDQVLTYKNLQSGEYYNDFLRPQSIHSQMSVFLWTRDRLLGGFNLFRPQNAKVFSSRDRAKAELMLPYLAEGLNKALISDTVREQEIVMDSILESLPCTAIVLMNESFETVYCSKRAAAILARLYSRDQGPHDGLKTLTKVLRARLKDTPQSGARDTFHYMSQTRVPLGSSKSGQRVLAVIVPLRNQERHLLAVCICSPNEERKMKEALQDFGFSRREAEVALLLSRGLKNHEIGKRLYISEYTVENHLRSIFRKLSVANRTAATHRLLTAGYSSNFFNLSAQ